MDTQVSVTEFMYPCPDNVQSVACSPFRESANLLAYGTILKTGTACSKVAGGDVRVGVILKQDKRDEEEQGIGWVLANLSEIRTGSRVTSLAWSPESRAPSRDFPSSPLLFSYDITTLRCNG